MKALIVAVASDWIGLARLPQALRQAGFVVRVLCPKNAYVSRSSFLEASYVYDSLTSKAAYAQGFQRVFDAWPPDLIVPGDDVAVQLMHELSRMKEMGVSARVAEVIERSLGDPARYAEIELKSLLGRAAAATGAPLPPQIVSPSIQEALPFVQRHGLPVVVKMDYTMAGQGVRICRAEVELIRCLGQPAPPNTDLLRRPATFCLQKFVPGTPAAVSLAAHRGKMAAAFAFRKEHSFPSQTGPTSVARFIDRPDLMAVAARLVEYFGYTGFAGVDFMLEETTETAHLIEFNARPTPTCHLGRLLGADLCAALHAALTQTPAPEPPPGPRPEVVALFPNELLRDKNSQYLRFAYHDVPWDDLPLLRHVLNETTGKALVS
jgi:ATP-grasp domain